MNIDKYFTITCEIVKMLLRKTFKGCDGVRVGDEVVPALTDTDDLIVFAESQQEQLQQPFIKCMCRSHWIL